MESCRFPFSSETKVIKQEVYNNVVFTVLCGLGCRNMFKLFILSMLVLKLGNSKSILCNRIQQSWVTCVCSCINITYMQGLKNKATCLSRGTPFCRLFLFGFFIFIVCLYIDTVFLWQLSYFIFSVTVLSSKKQLPNFSL